MTVTPLVSVSIDPLARATSGDHAAFAELVREHESMVFSIAWHVLRDSQLTEELAQEVFLQLYRNLGTIESAEHLVFWLRRVTSNRCIDLLRRRQFLPVPLEQAELPGASPEESDPILRSRLRYLVATLPAAQRVAVTLRYQEDLDPREIAEVLELPLNTVKSHLRRALATLRAELGDAEKETSP
ncbi:MAG: RNA polymerase sigma factor [Thermoanaerobaculia bacterium]